MGNISKLPADIVLDIIARLPAESILECKLVCKPWRNLVSYSRSFSRLHLTHHLNHSSADSGMLSFLLFRNKNQFCYMDYDENNEEAPIHSIRRINLTLPSRYGCYTNYSIIGSINGLVCLYEFIEHAIYICNPMTREYVKLPNPNNKRNSEDPDRHYVHCSSGFGYIPLTNEYKVIELYTFNGQHDFVEVAVYTLGSGKGWRNVGIRLDADFFKEDYAEYGVFLDGALHWVEEGGRRFFYFDLTEEKLCQHDSRYPLPPGSSMLDDRSIVVLGGALYYALGCLRSGRHTTELWLLKEKTNIREMKQLVEHKPLGWSKEFSLPGTQPLAFTKSGGVLCYDYMSLSIYEPVNSTLKKLVDFSASCQMFPHKNTLVSLKELGEEDIRVMESAEIEETAVEDPWIHLITGNAQQIL